MRFVMLLLLFPPFAVSPSRYGEDVASELLKDATIVACKVQNVIFPLRKTEVRW